MYIFGSRLKEERHRLGLSQSEMADAGGVARRTYVNYESGEREPAASFMDAIGKAGADILYILTGQRSPAQPAGVAEPAAEPTTPRETALLDNYRHCDEEGQKALETLARSAAQRDEMKSAGAAPARTKRRSGK